MNSDSPILETRNVAKEFGYRKVLENINLELRQGRLMLLLGKNGSGKSTLMKIMSGLTRPSEGNVLFQQKNVVDDPMPFRKSIGFITHNSNFYGDLTARENLVFAAKLRRLKSSRQLVLEVLDKTGLAKFADVRIKIFSSGMMKRLNIARLLLLRPDILLLDEPYTGLDYDSTDFFNRYLAEFKESGGAVLLISHQIETCFELSDDIAIIEGKTIKRHIVSKEVTQNQLLQEYHHLTD